MEKKQLKKLVLHKEPIANLNDMNMSKLHGGGFTTYPCVITIIESIRLSWDIYNGIAEPKSWWPYDCPTDPELSDVIMYGGCYIDPVVVTP